MVVLKMVQRSKDLLYDDAKIYCFGPFYTLLLYNIFLAFGATLRNIGSIFSPFVVNEIIHLGMRGLPRAIRIDSPRYLDHV